MIGAGGGGAPEQLAVAAGEIHHDGTVGGQRQREGFGPSDRRPICKGGSYAKVRLKHVF